MKFEWDEAKNRANFRKHGVKFEWAIQIFDGPIVTVHDDREFYGEERELTVGIARGVTVLAVVHTDREGTTRIISARKANRHEKQDFEATVF